MNNLTLLIPANKEVESLPTFLDELQNFDCHKMVVVQEEDLETINVIRNFNNIKMFIQKKKDMEVH